MNTKINSKYFFFGALILAIVLAGAIFWPFLTVLVLGASLAVLLYPLYKLFNKKMPWQDGWFSAILTLLCFIVVLCVPLFIGGAIIFKETSALYHSITTSATPSAYIANINHSIQSFLPTGVTFNVEDKIAQIVSSISNQIAHIFTATLDTLFSFLLVILATFYFLKDGARWKKALILLSPLPDADDEKVLTKLEGAITGVVRGYLLIALIQGALVGIGLTVFGVPNAALFGMLAAIASLIPSIGTAIVCVPIILYLFATGQTGAGVGFAIWAAVLVGMIDNVLNPVLVGRKMQIPPLLILFAVLGGVSMMGPVGILIGPLAVSFLYALISIYRSSVFF